MEKERKFRAAALVVGNEILLGRTRDTNTLYLIDRLLEKGLKLKKWLIVPDEREEISRSAGELLAQGYDLIVVSGGMGPTHDDITVESVAEGLKLPLERSRETYTRMVEKWNRFFPEREMPPESRKPLEKMSRIPDGSKPLHNENGMAEGIHIEIEGTSVVIVPGVPREYKAVIGGDEFHDILPRGDPADQRIEEILFRGGESQISEFMERLQMENPDIDLGSYPQGPKHVIIRITGIGDRVDDLIIPIERKVKEMERYNQMQNG